MAKPVTVVFYNWMNGMDVRKMPRFLWLYAPLLSYIRKDTGRFRAKFGFTEIEDFVRHVATTIDADYVGIVEILDIEVSQLSTLFRRYGYTCFFTARGTSRRDGSRPGVFAAARHPSTHLSIPNYPTHPRIPCLASGSLALETPHGLVLISHLPRLPRIRFESLLAVCRMHPWVYAHDIDLHPVWIVRKLALFLRDIPSMHNVQHVAYEADTKALIDFLKTRERAVWMGDFNMPVSEFIERMKEKHGYTLIPCSPSVPTWHTLRATLGRYGKLLEQNIDGILCSDKSVVVSESGIMESASDHLGIWARLQLHQ